MIISPYAEKAFDKIQYPFMIKKKKKDSQQTWYRGNIFQDSKGYLWETNS